MSINEAIIRRNLRGRQSEPSGHEGFRQQQAQQEMYKAEALQKGMDILRDAGAVDVLEELRDHILPESPDARLENVDPTPSETFGKFHFTESGMVRISMGWNYTEEGRYNRINVLAQPLTGAIVVEGQGAEFIPATTWKSPEGKAVLEDAIAGAYSTPPRYAPSVRIG